LLELNIGESSLIGPSLGLGDRVCGNIDRPELSTRAPLSQRDCLSTGATSSLEHLAPIRVNRVGVQQVDQGSALMVQALVLPSLISVYISFAHGSTFTRCRSLAFTVVLGYLERTAKPREKCTGKKERRT
jgi:hypothetical protein